MTNKNDNVNIQDNKKMYLDFTAYLYPRIGKRIKGMRKKTGCTLDEFVSNESREDDSCWMDKSILSRIENGVTEKRKNPYLLSSAHIGSLAEKFNITKEELVWGDREEQKQFAKIIIVSILCNSSNLNPFCCYDSYEELFNYANKQEELTEELSIYLPNAEDLPYLTKEKISDTTQITPAGYPTVTAEELKKKVDIFFENKYGFFYSRENHDAYDILKNEYHKELKTLSNLLFNLILHDYRFANGFARRAVALIQKRYLEEDKFIEKMTDFYASPSQYINLAINNKEKEYNDFAIAFIHLWERKEKDFMAFFDKHIFKNKKVEGGLKYFRNEDFMSIIMSDELFRLCETALIMEEFTEPEAVLSKNIIQNFYQLEVQKYITKQNSKHGKVGEGDSNVLDYLTQNIIKTEEYADKYSNSL